MNKPPKNSIDDINALLSKSGNNFHYKVVKYLRNQEWLVKVSPYYNDSFSQRPREIDLIAEKAFPTVERYGDKKGCVIVRLFIECKYIANPSIFWFDNRDNEGAKNIIKETNKFGDPYMNLDLETNHHYLSKSPIAKLFDSEKQEQDPIFKALTQSLNSLTYYRNTKTALSKKYDRFQITEINYPIIICNSFDNFFGCDTVSKNDEPFEIKEPFQIEVDYAYIDVKTNPLEELFYIDVLPFDKIIDFEEMLTKNDIRLAIQKMQADFYDNRP